MQQMFFMSLGAGAASAMLTLSMLSGSPLSVLLVSLAPLPVLIAALGWTHWTGLASALIAAVTVGAALGPGSVPGYLMATGLPAWWLGYLTMLARPASSGELEWYPVGRILVWAALLATAIIAAGCISAFGPDQESIQAGLRRWLERLVRAQSQGATDPLLAPESKPILDYLVGTLPLTAVAFVTTMNAFTLWLAGRTVATSGRLKRPWPDVPGVTLPPLTIAALAAAVVGSLLPDLAGFICSLLAASLFTIYAMLGFAVLHTVTRGLAGRRLMLFTAYVVVVVFSASKWALLAMSMVGLADTAFGMRARFVSRHAPPTIQP
jgi:predicted membrane protein DUF2232